MTDFSEGPSSWPPHEVEAVYVAIRLFLLNFKYVSDVFWSTFKPFLFDL
jgi:hypothetical protein